MTFDKQGRTPVELKPNRSCNHRIIVASACNNVIILSFHTRRVSAEYGHRRRTCVSGATWTCGRRHNDAVQSQTGHLRRSGVALLLKVLTLIGGGTATSHSSTHRPGGQTGVAAAERATELAAETRRHECIDERIHARVGVGQHVRRDATVVECVRAFLSVP